MKCLHCGTESAAMTNGRMLTDEELRWSGCPMCGKLMGVNADGSPVVAHAPADPEPGETS